MNKKLQESNQELESQRKLLTTQKNDLIELNHIKDTFFGIVGHDLRSPIGTLTQVADLYFDQKELFDPSDLKQLELSFKRTINNIYNLTENLISWAKLQMKREPSVPELVNVLSTVESILMLFKEKIESKHLDIQLDITQNSTVYCDKNQFEFIIRNLLNNSTKFCRVNDTIWISAIRTNENPSLLKIEIKDTGLGMSEAIQKKLFKIEQSNFNSKGTDGETGSGLGLILCKEFAELNNGKISFQSNKVKAQHFGLNYQFQPHKKSDSKQVSIAK